MKSVYNHKNKKAIYAQNTSKKALKDTRNFTKRKEN